MTVCLAAICGGLDDKPTIVAAADRMLTAGDIQFQWDRPKGDQFKIGAISLVAGSALHYTAITRRVNLRLEAETITSVIELAEMFRQAFSEERAERACQTHLSPLGLDLPTFLSVQAQLAPQEASRLVLAITNANLGDQFIVAGTDQSGAHVYVIGDPGTYECFDHVGFVAVGSGGRHAQAAFMLGGYSQKAPLGVAALQTYVAKKRSEVAPGVGEHTDLWVVHSNGKVASAPPEGVDHIFRSHFNNIVKGEQDVRKNAEAEIDKLFRAAYEEQTKPQLPEGQAVEGASSSPQP